MNYPRQNAIMNCGNENFPEVRSTFELLQKEGNDSSRFVLIYQKMYLNITGKAVFYITY